MRSTRAARGLAATSVALALPLAAAIVPAQADVTEVQRLSVSSAERQAFGGLSAVSTTSDDGRYVAFYSAATNLVRGDTNGARDVFVRDRQLGTTRRVSVGASGQQGNGDSDFGAISGNGRYVVFQSLATNLVGGAPVTNYQVYRRDRTAGTTQLVGVSSTGVRANDAASSPSVSRDGRYVAFSSSADNLVAGDTNGVRDIFVRDMVGGTTRRVSLTSNEQQGQSAPFSGQLGASGPLISGDGRHVAFTADYPLAAAADTNVVNDVYVRHLAAGTTELVTPGAPDGQYTSSSLSGISASGRYVTFTSHFNGFVPNDTNRTFDVFLRDTNLDTTRRISVGAAGQANGQSREGQAPVSADGRYVAFSSDASNLVTGDTNGVADVFVRDTSSQTTRRVSVTTGGAQANGLSQSPSLTPDGRYVTYTSLAANLVGGDTNGTFDVFGAVRTDGP